jgi:uncharacterized alkaline shock family protein YloU
MSDEIRIDGLGIAPGVLETIVSQAASAVDGVSSVETGQGLAGLVGKAGGKGVEVDLEGGSLDVALHIAVGYGDPLHEVARGVQSAVAEALESMTGQSVRAVDVYVDDVVFPG